MTKKQNARVSDRVAIAES